MSPEDQKEPKSTLKKAFSTSLRQSEHTRLTEYAEKEGLWLAEFGRRLILAALNAYESGNLILHPTITPNASTTNAEPAESDEFDMHPANKIIG